MIEPYGTKHIGLMTVSVLLLHCLVKTDAVRTNYHQVGSDVASHKYTV